MTIADMKITLYHNPKCSNARGVLALLRERGMEPTLVEYLHTPLSIGQLQALLAKTGKPVRELMRQKEAIYSELDLDNPKHDETALLGALAAHPVLFNRPVVEIGDRAQVCRPPETVLAFLDACHA